MLAAVSPVPVISKVRFLVSLPGHGYHGVAFQVGVADTGSNEV